MTISIDERGNVTIDRTHNPSNITNLKGEMDGILSSLKLFDPSQITNSSELMNQLYKDTLDNFSQFLDEWEEVRNGVNL